MCASNDSTHETVGGVRLIDGGSNIIGVIVIGVVVILL